jgi:hypothetical protein
MFGRVVFPFMQRIFEDFLAGADAALSVLGSPQVTGRWEAPSACVGFTVGGLAAHLGWQVQGARLAAAAERPAAGAVVTELTEHYGKAAWIGVGPDSAANVAIRDTNEQRAEVGPVEVLRVTREARDELAAQLSTLNPQEVVAMPWIEGRAMTLGDLLTTRLLELLIHTDDLAVSVGLDTPQATDSGYEAVIGLLTRLSVGRHGPIPVLRALSRAERAPESIVAL